ncbi:MAG: phosphodiester glycosidase family protein [Clostridiaceae bacterium]|nr:phosphodiester glycosidase family protein [Clostridiaceae bacterium]
MKRLIRISFVCMLIFLFSYWGIKGRNNSSKGVMKYSSETLTITIEPIIRKDIPLKMWVSTIKIKDPKQLKSAFAGNKFSDSKKEKTSSIAKKHKAIIAINGAAVGFNTTGMVIRDGKIYRGTSLDFAPLIIYKNGDLHSYEYGEKTVEQLIEEGAVHTFDFGPDLIKDGKIVDWGAKRESKINWYQDNTDPHTAIGQCGPLEYIIITVDGRSKASKGISYAELALEFKNRGCNWAYNLDGGGSTTLYYLGKVLNHPSDIFGERRISDILYFTE